MTDKEVGERRAKFEGMFTPEPNTGCFTWTGAAFRTSSGQYGTFQWANKNEKVHRLAWFFAYGKFPLLLDHKCRVTLCGNVRHLEEITNKENVLRGAGLTAVNARKTECEKKHPLSGINLYIYKGERYCKSCRRQYLREWRKQHGR